MWLIDLRGKLATILVPICQITLGAGVPSTSHVRVMSSPEFTLTSLYGSMLYGGT